MKRILDSVHGHISVDARYFDGIIDTPHFQRLRHIEQTSTRSIFPSAHHDRFIHSLGVFHIGKMICSHVIAELQQSHIDHNVISLARIERIKETYLLACLLHDVGHAPFSHTFEDYYGNKKNLAKKLHKLINSETFSKDLNEKTSESPAHHEYSSAILSVRVYKQKIDELQADIELLVRMIIGCKYTDESKSLENTFIELIHGNVIDADRLDYACRDVWASGYSTSTIDLTRLIAAIHISYNMNEGKYIVCFDVNALNEIESVIQVKDFQVRYTINHHKVKLEQYLLTKAVGYLAMQLFEHSEIENLDDRETKALFDLFDIESLVNPIHTVNGETLFHISDGDLIYLMKKHDQNHYFRQWFSRQYNMKPVWKSPTEFIQITGLKSNRELSQMQLGGIIDRIVSALNLCDNQYLAIPVTYKAKVNLDNAIFRLKDNYVKGCDLPFRDGDSSHNKYFIYLYIDKDIMRAKGAEIVKTIANIKINDNQ